MSSCTSRQRSQLCKRRWAAPELRCQCRFVEDCQMILPSPLLSLCCCLLLLLGSFTCFSRSEFSDKKFNSHHYNVLVHLVHLFHLVYLIHLVHLVHMYLSKMQNVISKSQKVVVQIAKCICPTFGISLYRLRSPWKVLTNKLTFTCVPSNLPHLS